MHHGTQEIVEPYEKIISFMHLSLDGFAAGPSRYLPAGRQVSGGEMNRIKVDEEIFDQVGKIIISV